MRPFFLVLCLVCVPTFAFAIATDDEPIVFRRGDVNGDHAVDGSDPVALLNYLYNGSFWPLCHKACDANDDGRLDNSDAVTLMTYLYNGGSPPPYPGPFQCGTEGTPDSLSCVASSCGS